MSGILQGIDYDEHITLDRSYGFSIICLYRALRFPIEKFLSVYFSHIITESKN